MSAETAVADRRYRGYAVRFHESGPMGGPQGQTGGGQPPVPRPK